ncbi:MAG: hypothetical protein ABIG94_05125 [Pseudomonadota bacterium]
MWKIIKRLWATWRDEQLRQERIQGTNTNYRAWAQKHSPRRTPRIILWDEGEP